MANISAIKLPNNVTYDLKDNGALRLTNIFQTSASLSTSGWSSYKQTVTVSGVTSSSAVIVSPAPASFETYGDMGIYCSAQGTNSLTFTCETVPSAALTVNILVINL